MAEDPPVEYQSVKNYPKTKLKSGDEIPMLGLGTWKAKPGEVGNAVENSLRLGYRHIDCAAVYGNQDEIGRALQKVFAEGKIKRRDVWITSKLWNRDHGRVREACQQTLKDLQIDYLDLYHMHWPVEGPLDNGASVQPPVKDTWAEMEKLVDARLTRNIGTSNFSVKKIKDLLSTARIPPAVEQIEGHAYLRNDYVIAWCKSQGIHVTTYSPLGTPDPNSVTLQPNVPVEVPPPTKDPLVQQIAEKHGKHVAQVLLRWGLQRGTSQIPKATNVEHLRSNLEVLDFELPKEDFHALNTLGYQKRMLDGGKWLLKPEGPYETLTQLWDGEEWTGWPPGTSYSILDKELKSEE